MQWRWTRHPWLLFACNRGEYSSSSWISNHVWNHVNDCSNGQNDIRWADIYAENIRAMSWPSHCEKRLPYFLQMRCYQLNEDENRFIKFYDTDMRNTMKFLMFNEEWTDGDQNWIGKMNQLYDYAVPNRFTTSNNDWMHREKVVWVIVVFYLHSTWDKPSLEKKITNLAVMVALQKIIAICW